MLTEPLAALTIGTGATLRLGAIWAYRQKASAPLRSFQQTLDGILKLLFIGKADKCFGDAAVAIDHERGGQSLNAAVLIAGFIVAEHDAIVDLLLGGEGRNGLPAVIVHGDAKDFEAAALVSALEFLKPGD